MNTYWRSIEELNNPQELHRDEVREEAKQKSMLLKGDQELNASSRRDFLKTFGFSIAAASIIASCKRPVDKAIPYLMKPDEVTPGIADYYSTSYFEGNEYGSILVKSEMVVLSKLKAIQSVLFHREEPAQEYRL